MFLLWFIKGLLLGDLGICLEVWTLNHRTTKNVCLAGWMAWLCLVWWGMRLTKEWEVKIEINQCLFSCNWSLKSHVFEDYFCNFSKWFLIVIQSGCGRWPCEIHQLIVIFLLFLGFRCISNLIENWKGLREKWCKLRWQFDVWLWDLPCGIVSFGMISFYWEELNSGMEF